MPQGQSEGINLRQQTKLWDSYPVKSPSLRHRQALSQNKELSRASRLGTGPSPARDRQAEGSQSRKGAIVAPERHHLPNCKQTLLLTKTSWHSGQLTSAGRVAARGQRPRRDTRHA